VKYRTFGRTGFKVSELVLGCGNVGGLFVGASRPEQTAIVKAAMQSGINWFDTAPQYGQGSSENNLGSALQKIEDRPYVSSKFRLEKEDLKDIPTAIEANLMESLTRLKLNHIDLYQLHNFLGHNSDGRTISVQDVLKPGGVVEGLTRMQKQGLINFTGFTAKGHSMACLEVARSGKFDAAQIYYNMLNPSASRMMPSDWTGQDFLKLMEVCRQSDMGVMAIRVFAAGVLATDQRHGRESVLTEKTDLRDEERKAQTLFQNIGLNYGTRAQTAIRFCLGNPDLSCINIGIADQNQLDEAVLAIDLGPPPEQLYDELNLLYQRNFS